MVEGSVRRSGNHIRVSVQLIDALTDRHIWAQNYDRTLADSLALAGELATEIAAACGRDAQSARKGARGSQADEQSCCLRCLSAWPRICQLARHSDKSDVEGAIQSLSGGSEVGSQFLHWLGHVSPCAEWELTGASIQASAAGGSQGCCSIVLSRSTQTCRKRTLLLAITAITGSAILRARWLSFSSRNRVFRTMLTL